jgi:AraC-like DNA-binding protein/quercetin dioxygenase-like cupin family protein
MTFELNKGFMKTSRKYNARTSVKWLEDIYFRGTDAPVLIYRVEPQDDIERHIHDFTELTLILDGAGVHDFENESYRLKQGDCFIVEPGMHHAYRSTDRLKLVNILIRSSFVEKFGAMLKEDPAYPLLLPRTIRRKNNSPSRASLSLEELEICMRIVNEIDRESREMKRSHGTMMTGLLLELCAKVFRSVHGSDPLKDDMRSPWLSKILDYMEIHFAEDIPISHLRKMAGMSERSFQRHFLEMTGLTPLRYILHLRIARASRMLREENKTVYEAASFCGMENCSYFCRLFKKITGHSPMEYAKLSKRN